METLMKQEKLLVWQKSKEIYIDVSKKFARCDDSDFVCKIREGALNTMDSIAN